MLRVYSDSDWAGCKQSRRSRSGGIATLAGGIVKSWCNRQATVAMSSGEAEYYAIVKAGAEALGIQAVALDLGWDVRAKLFVDSSAARAFGTNEACGGSISVGTGGGGEGEVHDIEDKRKGKPC